MPEVDGGFATDVPSSYMKVRRWMRAASPTLFSRLGTLELWQAIGIAVLLLASFIIAYLVSWIVISLLRLAVGGRQVTSERQFRWPLRIALVFLLYSVVVPALGLPEAIKRVSTGITGVIIAVAMVWGGWKLLDTFRASAMRRAETRAGTLDEIVVSLVLGTCKLVLLAGGFIFIAQALSIPYEGVVAGLGIGGLAFAFASKETLSNVFGAGILVADRPFRRGDWIEAGDAKGTVEHVGIRSTRIRTSNDSLMFIPNGKLADATVNNLGTRRHRVATSKLLVAHGTGAGTLTTFIDDVATLIRHTPHVQPSSVQVGVTAITPDGIEVEIGCCLDVHAAADERADKTALMLGVLRLADRLNVRLGNDEPLLPATAAPSSVVA